MKKRLINSLALCSLVCLGTIGLVSCEQGIAIDKLQNVVNAEGKIEAKVNVTYTLGLNIQALENDTVTWTSDSPSAITLVKGDEAGLTCSFTAKKAGNYTISAFLESEPNQIASIGVTATKGKEGYALSLDTKEVKKTYLQGDRFTGEGLKVTRVLTVDGTETGVKTTLTEDDYEIDIADGTILSSPGELPVNVTVEGIDEPAVYEITIAENEIYPFIEFARNLGDNNYTIVEPMGNQLVPARLVSSDYIVDATLGEIYQETADGVVKYIANEDGSLSKKGFYYKDILTPVENLDEMNLLQHYDLGSSFKESWFKDVKKTNVDLGDGINFPGFKISKNIAEYFLGVSGKGILGLNYDVLDGEVIFEEGIAEIFCNISIDLGDGTGAQVMPYPVIIANVGESFAPEFEELMAKATIDNSVEPALKQAIDTIGQGNFRFRTNAFKNPQSGVYQFTEYTATDNYFVAGQFESAQKDLSNLVGEEFGFVNIPGATPEEGTVREVKIGADGILVPGEDIPGFTNYRELGFKDPAIKGLGYTVDPTQWAAFAQPNIFEDLPEGIYNHWNLEYVIPHDEDKGFTEGYALYGEVGAADVMYSLFNVPYGSFKSALGGTYHSVFLDLDFNEKGQYQGFELSVRVSLPSEGEFADLKGYPIPWDAGRVVASGVGAKNAKIEEYLASLKNAEEGKTEA